MARLLGLIGGVSPESTPIYYRHLNEAARAARGGESSMPMLIASLDYGVMIRHYHARDWVGFIAEVAIVARRLADGGASALVICSNTTHIAADAASEASGLPVIHLVDAVADAMRPDGVRRPLLLGTPYVMTGDYYLPEFERRFGAPAVVPDAEGQALVGRIILDELTSGVVRGGARNAIAELVAAEVREKGCDGVILGCTELCMVHPGEAAGVPVYDTTLIHARAAAAYALAEV